MDRRPGIGAPSAVGGRFAPEGGTARWLLVQPRRGGLGAASPPPRQAMPSDTAISPARLARSRRWVKRATHVPMPSVQVIALIAISGIFYPITALAGWLQG